MHSSQIVLSVLLAMNNKCKYIENVPYIKKLTHWKRP